MFDGKEKYDVVAVEREKKNKRKIANEGTEALSQRYAITDLVSFPKEKTGVASVFALSATRPLSSGPAAVAAPVPVSVPVPVLVSAPIRTAGCFNVSPSDRWRLAKGGMVGDGWPGGGASRCLPDMDVDADTG